MVIIMEIKSIIKIIVQTIYDIVKAHGGELEGGDQGRRRE